MVDVSVLETRRREGQVLMCEELSSCSEAMEARITRDRMSSGREDGDEIIINNRFQCGLKTVKWSPRDCWGVGRMTFSTM